MGFFGWLFGTGEDDPLPPEQIAETEIIEKTAKLQGFEAKIADLMSRREDLNTSLGLAQHEVSKWTLIQEAAIETKNETNVFTAVQQRMQAEQKRDRLQEELNAIGKTIGGLKESLQFANDKIDISKAKHANLAARLESAKIRTDLAGVDGPVKSMSDLEDETYQAEGKAQTEEEMSKFHQDFVSNNVVQNIDVNAEVDRLMGKKK